MKHLGFASIPSVQQYLRYAKAKKLDIQRLISLAGISPELLKNDNGRIQGIQFQTLMEILIEQANDPLLGLNSSLFVQTQSYSAPGYIALNCTTIGEVIERIPLFERLVGDMGTTTLHKQPGELIITWHCAYPSPTVRPQMIDNILLSWTLYARWLAKSQTNAKRVMLSRSDPGPALKKQYEERFACPVEFNHKDNSIVLDDKLLRFPLHHSDEQRLRTLEGQARSQLSNLHIEGDTFRIQVLRSIKAHLQMGVARKELIAQEFNISLRTVQRRLDHENSSYQMLLDEVRFERARALLIDTNLSLKDIAYNIGFSDERSFYRSFKAWAGMSPGEYRRKDREECREK